MNILDRYLIRDAAAAWAAVTLVLLSIMLATRFAFFLALSAKGDLPPSLLFEVVALSSLRYLVLLLPVSLLLGVMLSLGRLYKDNEIAALTGCGIGARQFYRPYVMLGLGLAALTAALAFVVSPWSARQADAVLKDAKRLVQYTPFESGRFKPVSDAKAVFYTSEISEDGTQLGQVLAFVESKGQTALITAQHGTQAIDPATGERQVVLLDGQRVEAVAGQAQTERLDFAHFITRITPPALSIGSSSRAVKKTSVLLASDDPKDRAELHWRIAAPVSALVLLLLAVPLGYLAPRQGRYSKLVWAILAYLAYSNLLSLGQTWLAKGTLPALVGLWWVHALFLLVAGTLIWRRSRI
jgi:lipopolysaccharide export system permease protein